MRINAQVIRSNTLGTNLRLARVRYGQKVERALKGCADYLLQESLKLVPRDTEALADSGRVSKINSMLDVVMVVGYGGKDFPPRDEISKKTGQMVHREPHVYTVIVHEWKKPQHSPGQYNFLREPLMTRLSEMRSIINTILQQP